jgi:hypothetical protein
MHPKHVADLPCLLIKHIIFSAMYGVNMKLKVVKNVRGQKKNSPVSCFPTVPRFYPPTLNFLWPQIKLQTKTFSLDIRTGKN